MRVKVLGCSGGVGPGLRTTSLLLDDDVLLDAGTGVGDLDLAQLAGVRHVFLTHSHLDHICGLAFLADNLFGVINAPVHVHATDATLAILQRHIFNWVIWPDFSQLPSPTDPILRWASLPPGQVQPLGDARLLHSFAVEHTVPAVGFAVQCPRGVFAFSGDTCDTPGLWQALDALPRLDALMIEVAFSNADAAVAALSKHFTPQSLAQGLRRFRHRPRLYLTHHKPGSEEPIQDECRDALAGWDYHHLRAGDCITL